MFDQPILVYSTYCNHSIQLLENLVTNHKETIYDKIIRMNIDVDPETNNRPKIFEEVQKLINKRIDKVPTLILEDTTLLTENGIHEWIESKTVKSTPEISGFGSFGDDNNFTSFSSQSKNTERTSEKKVDVDSRLEKLMEERKILDNNFKQPGRF